ncbi:hypothetical protein SAMN02745181_1722 [Rubritalea squalenifaciens DSM 18772]|uniref:Uncharacterized protein n=2 Tax=Rubritalea TaxID=361050 RepID=A0A1M6I8W2_9BACT|nr:hypothetical protein SAMN02745181_1722 [Rubritalea squalenifaciens DSM 18772]
MNTFSAYVMSQVEKLLRFLASMKSRRSMNQVAEQLELPFGVKSHFQVNSSVRRKHR